MNVKSQERMSQAHTLQQILDILTSMNNGIPIQIQNSPDIIHSTQIKPFNISDNHQTEAERDGEVENPATVFEQQGNSLLAMLYIYW